MGNERGRTGGWKMNEWETDGSETKKAQERAVGLKVRADVIQLRVK